MSEILRTLGVKTSEPYIVTKGDRQFSLRKVGVKDNAILQAKKYDSTNDLIKRWYSFGDMEVIVPKKEGFCKIITDRHSADPKTVLKAYIGKKGKIEALKDLDLNFINAKTSIPNSAKRLINLVSKYLMR